MPIVIQRQKGILCMLLSSFFFAAMQIMVKMTAGKIPVFEQVFFRNLVTMIFCGGLCLIKKQPLFGHQKSRPYLLLRSLLGYGGVITYFYCIGHMPTADATILQKSSPIFVTLFAFWFLKEPITGRTPLILGLSLIGAMLVVKPTFHADLIPALSGLISAAFAGGAYTALSFVNKMEKTNTVIFFFSLVSTVLTLPFLIWHYVPPTAEQMMLLLAIGVFAGLGQIFLTLGYRFAPAGEVSIYTYSTIVFAAVMGYMAFGDTIDRLTLAGILIIFGAQLYGFRFRHREVRLREKERCEKQA